MYIFKIDESQNEPGLSEHSSKNEGDSKTDKDNNTENRHHLSHIAANIKRCMNWTILKDPRLYLYCAARCFYHLVSFAPMLFLPELMIQTVGVDETKAGSSISIYGIGWLFGGIIFGSATKYCKIHALFMETACVFILGSITASFACYSNYSILQVLAFLFGMFNCAAATLRPLSLIDMFELKSLNEAYSMVMVANGFGSIFGPPMIGAIKHAFGTYYYSYLIMSGVFYLTGSLMGLIIVIH